MNVALVRSLPTPDVHQLVSVYLLETLRLNQKLNVPSNQNDLLKEVKSCADLREAAESVKGPSGLKPEENLQKSDFCLQWERVGSTFIPGPNETVENI